MARSKKIKKRSVLADPIYQNRIITKLINKVMKDGKKAVAMKSVYGALDIVSQKVKQDLPINIFRQALDNIKPSVEVKSRRVGGAAYQVPQPVRGDRKEAVAIRWLVAAARLRSSKDYHSFSEKLAAEIMDAYNNLGGAIKKREDNQRMADANRAFAHFRW